MPSDYPYPTPFEILRYLVRCFDLKQSNKRLDDQAAMRIYDPRELKAAIAQYLTEESPKYIGNIATAQVSKITEKYFEIYLRNIVGKIPAFGVSRSSVLELLIKTIVKDYVVTLVHALHKDIGGPHPSFWFSTEGSLMGAMFDWLAENEPNWGAYLACQKKERRDMMTSWSKGHALPSAQSINLLPKSNLLNGIDEDAINWNQVKPLLFISRAIDFIKREPLGLLLIQESRLALWGAGEQTFLKSEISAIQDKIFKSLGSSIELVFYLQNGLKRTVEKSKPDEYRNAICQLRALIQQSERIQSTEYGVDWHDARWHVFNGDLKRANELYKSAFERAIFLAGLEQEKIIHEAMVVAANQTNPDSVFLKKLKWSLINFGYDIPSNTDTKPSQKATDTIEDWEIERLKSSFDSIFPKAGLFPGVEYDTSKNTLGPLFISDSSKMKPDYRHPNRVIKVGDTWQRAMPQLVWFALEENIDVCKKLIELGASVNVASEVGDTPILMALEALNVTEVPWRSLNIELWELISREEHTVQTINTRTQKKRLLSIISAIETGRPDIVKRLLEMGADPNSRGKTDEQTPLNVCLKLIGIVKNPEKFWTNQNAMQQTPEVLDAIRRHCSGLSGYTLDDQKQFRINMHNHPLFNDISDSYKRAKTERIFEKMSIQSMRHIAMQLIKSGADVNAEHSSPIKGYTPIMLAAELDERELFDAMLIAGGNLNKTYVDPRSGRDISIRQIAIFFNARRVGQSLL